MLVAACDSANNDKDESINFDDSSETFYYFDSQINIRFIALPGSDLDEVHEAIDALLKEVHCVATRYEDPHINCDGYTQIKTLNDNPNETFEVNPMVVEMIDMSLRYYNDPRTNGTFNIALGKVINVWSKYTRMCRNEQNCVVPEIDTLEAAAQNIDPNNITYSLEDNTVMVPEGMELDLGGIAKGYGAKRVGEMLREDFDDILNAWVVNAGTSNIEFYGNHPSDERDYWIGGLRDPFNPYFSHYARVQLHSGQNLVTSGDYDRFYVVDGVNYHHIIDPNTLFPSNHIRGVTVISEDPALGDIYSTIAFILPLEDAMDFINSLDDVEAIWMDADQEVHMTAGFEENHLYEPVVTNPSDSTETNQTVVIVTLVSILGVITITFILVVVNERKKNAESPDTKT